MSATIDTLDPELALIPDEEAVPGAPVEPDDRAGALDALRNRSFARFWIAFTLSMTGSWVRITALGVLAYDLTGDAFKLGLLSFCASVPELVVGPVAGAVLDRVDRRRVIVLTQLLALVTASTLSVLIFTDQVVFWHLLVAAAVIGVSTGFDWPARLALVPSLVTRREMHSAIALNMAGFNGARIIGPTIAGWLIAAIGIGICFAFTSVAVIPMILVVTTLTIARPNLMDRSNLEPPLTMLREGYRYIWQTPVIRGLLSVDIIPIALGMSYSTMAPAIARDVLDLPEGGLGWLLGMVGAGSLLGSFVVAFLARSRHRGRIVIAAVMAFGLGVIGFGLSSSIWISFPIAFGIGLAWSLYSTLGDTLVQTNVDESYRGRVVSVQSMFWGLSPIGGLLAGTLASWLDVQLAVAINGLLILLYAPYLWFRTPVRHLA
jgi:MFS family permease